MLKLFLVSNDNDDDDDDDDDDNNYINFYSPN